MAIETSLQARDLLVGTTSDYRPFSFRHDKELIGFDISLAEHIARKLGCNITFVPVTWPQLNKEKIAEHFDLLMSGLTVAPHRQTLGDFSQPYTVNQTVIMGPSGLRIDSMERFLDAHPNLKIGVNKGGYLERYGKRNFPKHELVTVTCNPDLPKELLDGVLDVFLTDRIEAQVFTREHAQLTVLAVLEEQRQAILISKYSKCVTAATVNEVLNQLESEGKLTELRDQFELPHP